MNRRTVWTPCCKHPQQTRKKPGEIIMCSKCHNPFVEPVNRYVDTSYEYGVTTDHDPKGAS